ncbi:hypothetical protein H8N00_19060 [Streptomyces sp. AC563]|uniref:hypothetical protein n=1 Tax=Streptomyces buecherae TaxID=2763006 RepID=UPI00164DA546|nr:hypothetical protein [Streptomyces buecherae]MBC3990938.1 hypothetical protein [Streptomyces buecherae]
MSEQQTIGREVRIFGALYCAVFAAISLAWIIRDLSEVDEASTVWWYWVGLGTSPSSGGLVTSSYYDLVLLVLYVATGLIVQRSAIAGSALVTVAVTTIALRLPSLWNLHADWMDGMPGGIATRAQLTCWSAVLVSAAVLLAVVAARNTARQRPPAIDQQRYGAAPPARLAAPTPGGAGAAFAVLGGIGLVLIGWQIYYAQDRGWEAYKRQLTGERYLLTVLGQPTGWVGWFVALLAVVAGALALRRAPYVRPLGLIAALLVIAYSVGDLSIIFKLEVLDIMDKLATNQKLYVWSSFAQVAAGLVALLALAPRGPEHVTGPPPGWGPQPTPGYGGDGYATPDGYGPGPSPRTYPSGGGYQGGQQSGGYQDGYPGGQQGGGYQGGYPGGYQGDQQGGYAAPPPLPASPPPPPPAGPPPANPPGSW